MPRRHRTKRWTVSCWLTGIALTLPTAVAGVVLLAQEPAPAPPAGGAPVAEFVLATGPGVEDFQRVCALCHTPDRIVTVRRTRTEWEEVLDKMVSRGAQITDDNYTPIQTYLLRNYGKVNVNRAVKDDLMLVAGLGSGEAESVLKARAENGPFADFEALAKVPGLDVKKLEQKKEALVF
jgi:competence ComEA-like helix-hairpin-helix protein